MDLPGVENAGGSASDVDISEGQRRFVIVHGLHMTPVHQQNDPFGVVVDYRHLRKDTQTEIFLERASLSLLSWMNSSAERKEMSTVDTLPHGSAHR